jgi:5'-nucleotidase
VAGIKYSFDKSVAPNAGRLKSVEVKDGAGWASLDPAKTYTIATNNFVRTGGDGYKIFAEKAETAYDFGPSLEQVLADYITAHSPYTPALDGRITMAQAAPSPSPASAEPAATPPAPSTPTQAPSAETTVPEPTTPAPTTPPADLTAAPEPAATAPQAAPAPEQPVAPETAEPAASGASAQASAPAVTAGGTHEIAQGDTLWDLAQAAYGDGTKWRRIARANPGVQAHRLLVGNQLTIPAAN